MLLAATAATFGAGCTRPVTVGNTAASNPPPDPVTSVGTTTPDDAATSPSTSNTTSTTTTPASTPASTPTATEARTDPAPNTSPTRISMAFTGDILPHSPLWRQAGRNAAAAGTDGYDFTPMLAPLHPVLDSVDLAVCHLETPIAPDGEAFTTEPLYGVPVEIVDAIVAAGYDRCSTASNHTADRGAAGVDRTVTALLAAGVGQSGMARFPAEIEPRVIDVAGVAVSHLSYTMSYNGLSFPNDEDWRSARIDPDRILVDAERARADGAALVVVSLHWGDEGIHAPTRYQREVAEAITAPGTIDLVVGHHAHVVQPIELVNDTWVVFGLGNILSNLPASDAWPAATQDAVVVTVGIEIDADGAVTVERPRAVPTWVDRNAGWIVRLVDTELARPDLGPGLRARLLASRERTSAVLADFVPPPPPPPAPESTSAP